MNILLLAGMTYQCGMTFRDVAKLQTEQFVILKYRMLLLPDTSSIQSFGDVLTSVSIYCLTYEMLYQETFLDIYSSQHWGSQKCFLNSFISMRTCWCKCIIFYVNNICMYMTMVIIMLLCLLVCWCFVNTFSEYVLSSNLLCKMVVCTTVSLNACVSCCRERTV